MEVTHRSDGAIVITEPGAGVMLTKAFGGIIMVASNPSAHPMNAETLLFSNAAMAAMHDAIGELLHTAEPETTTTPEKRRGS